MKLNQNQRSIIERVVNAFETGTARGKYDAVTVMPDGPHQMRQISYGRSQVTEYGKLDDLVRCYVEADGIYGRDLAVYVDEIGRTPLAGNRRFRSLLRRAGATDPVMRQVQDEFFRVEYFEPAFRWADERDFLLPLSALVVYDSFVHSGSILQVIRSRFREAVPKMGGDERKWIAEYVKARERFLASHERKPVRKTVYRTQCLAAEIARGNWDLTKLPIAANGVVVWAA